MSSQFHFAQQNTNWTETLSTLVKLLVDSKAKQVGQGVRVKEEQLQLVFVISDARVQQDRELVARWGREALSRGQLLVLVVVDHPDERQSIVNVKSVTYPNGKLQVVSYLKDFPFPFYVILRNLNALPNQLEPLP